MQNQQGFSFQDLKCKLVINVLDGKILGNIIDIIFFPQTGKILGFVVPGEKKGFFKPQETIFIPYNCVCKVGLDVVLVELFVNTKCTANPLKTTNNQMIEILNNQNTDPAFNENYSENDDKNYSEIHGENYK